MRPLPIRRLAAMVLLAVAVAGCSVAAGAGVCGQRDAGKELELTTIEQGSVPGKAGDQVRVVVRDESAWLRVWNDLTGGRVGSGKTDPTPAVDFDAAMVIAAAMPTQGCISRVTIRSIRAVEGGLVVDLLEQPPPPGVNCIVSERPFHAVRLERRNGPVRWEVETRPLDPNEPTGRPPSADR